LAEACLSKSLISENENFQYRVINRINDDVKYL